MTNHFYKFLLITFCLLSCLSFGNDTHPIKSVDFLGYDLSAPEKKISLPKDLMEISGLTYLENDILAAIQDEKGIIYHIDINKNEIVSKFRFAKNKDYEGIELAQNYYYIISSDGDLYSLNRNEIEDPRTVKFDTPLKAKNDVEGLAYDAHDQLLLIACKGDPKTKINNPNGKAIYAFSLKNNSFDLIYTINTDNLIKYLNQKNSKDVKFSPSAIAVHPITRDIFILSYVDRYLIALTKKGGLKAAVKLDSRLFKQPEGICFSPTGTLFISNEGKGSRGNILQFKYQY